MMKLRAATDLFPRDAVVSLIANASAFALIVGGYFTIVPMIVALTEPIDPRTSTDLVLSGGVLILFWSSVFLMPRIIVALVQIAGGEVRRAGPKRAVDTMSARQVDEPACDIATQPERIAAE